MSDLTLGRIHSEGTNTEQPYRYDSDNLVTHGVVFGMTGSGKTGLSITLLEELVLAGTPLILIDPKGDLPNLGLVFPGLTAEEFEPWVTAESAARDGISVEEKAEKTAQLWSRGLDDWGVDKARLGELRKKMDLKIYTPGAEDGIPVNVLGTFGPPPGLDDATARQELIAGSVSSLLSLVDVEADPVRDPRHIVLCQILDQAWSQGEELTFEALITQLVDPPFKKVGVFPLDTFFKPEDRMKLAMALNGVLASPSFAAWMKGETLDLPRLTSVGSKVPVSVFYLAHLSDSERMFFVSLLMERILAWSRTLPGSGGLRTLIYFDEVAGYLPPTKNPPTKKPIMTLMKQARAVGVGTMLATQNPVDIDYKALSNAGTWMIGRLQTAQDRERVMDGLLSASGGLDRGSLKELFGQLKPRVFLVKEAGEDQPVLYHTRWAMSYLRGPVTRAELSKFDFSESSDSSPDETSTPEAPPADGDLNPKPPPKPKGVEYRYLNPETVFSARMEDHFAHFAEPRREDGAVVFRPSVHAELQLRFDARKGGFVNDEVHHRVFFPLDGGLGSESVRLDFEDRDFLSEPPESSFFGPLPQALDEPEEFKKAESEIVEQIFRSVTSTQWINKELKLYGSGGESREDFESRCNDAIQDRIDEQLAKIQERYDKKVKRLEERIAKKRQKLEQLELTAKGRRTEQLFHAGELIMSFFTKRRRSVSAAIGKHRTASRSQMRAEHAGEELAELELQLEAIQDELQDEVDKIEEAEKKLLDAIEEETIRLDKSDIRMARFEVLWIPVSRRI